TYERTIDIPETWRGKHVVLWLERAHWVTEASLDGAALGRQESLSTPHEYDLGVIEPGTYTLGLSVDNSMAYGVGPNAHSMTDHTQSNWNGVIGGIELRAEPLVAIESIRVVPNAAETSALVSVTVINRSGSAASAILSASASNSHAPDVDTSEQVRVPSDRTGAFEFTVDLGPDAALWGEFTPWPYELSVDLESEHGTSTHTTWFGLRDIGHRDGRITLNDRSIFLRGTLDCAIFPLTGFPPMDVASWEKFFLRAKEFGLNHVRYHSWCPPRAAFLAADKVGIYLQVEGPFWVNQGPKLGLGDPIDGYVHEETDRILAEYGNHPSFVFMAYGNEPSGPGPRNQGENFLAEFLEHYKVEDPRRLYTSGAGWPIMEESQFHVPYEPRIQRWGEGLRSTINSEPPTTRRDYMQYTQKYDVPIVSHEIGQWCVFPDFDEMSKYTGVLKPKNFEIYRDFLANNGLAHRSRDFLHASGRLQTLAYKEEIEAALRTPRFGGFQLLDLRDFPGQGTALVGVLDPFWDPKPYITADEYERFAGPITPIARFDGRVFPAGSDFEATIEVAQFGPKNLDDATVSWELVLENGVTIGRGRLPTVDLPAGELTTLGDVSIRLRAPEATRATLTVSIDGTGEFNEWDIWIVSDGATGQDSSTVHITDMLDDKAEAILSEGGSVLLLASPDSVDNDVAFGFSPAFWNTAWTDGQAPHTLGLRVDPEHPLFDAFPTSSHADWQWWDLIGWPGARASAMVLADLPVELEPLVQPIDTWFHSRRLATMFECRVGEGRLIVSSFELDTDLAQRHATRQLRSSLMSYMESAEFAPTVDVSTDAIRGLFRPVPTIVRIGVESIAASSSERDYGPENAVDGDPTTMWHSAWTPAPVPAPHTLTLELAKSTRITGLRYLPRQTGGTNGRVGRYRIETSTNGTSWTVAARGTSPVGAAWQSFRFESARNARFIRFVAVDALGGGPYAAVAEVDLLTE
ncbi:MAG: discoidin domain-containing protein, partial [Planctomycetota bacterium]